jgi:hypothetical protein
MITIALLYDFMAFISHYLRSVCGEYPKESFIEATRLKIILNINMIQDHRSTQDNIAQIMCAIVLSANSYRELYDTMAFRPENEDDEGKENPPVSKIREDIQHAATSPRPHDMTQN